MNIEERLFSDDPKHLDKFGPLFLLTVAAVGLNSLVDLNSPLGSVGRDIGWVAASSVVGVTLMLAVRAGGVARRPRIIVDVVVWLAIIAAVTVALVDVFGTFVDPRTEPSAGSPSILWVVIAFLSPVVVLRRVFMQDRVTRRTLLGAISVFLLTALAFQYAFMAVGSWSDVPFFGSNEPTTTFMYFSLVTITTLGYGDFSPATDLGRLLATTEAVLGQVFLVTVIARLVSLYGTKLSPRPQPDQVAASDGATDAT